MTCEISTTDSKGPNPTQLKVKAWVWGVGPLATLPSALSWRTAGLEGRVRVSYSAASSWHPAAVPSLAGPRGPPHLPQSLRMAGPLSVLSSIPSTVLHQASWGERRPRSDSSRGLLTHDRNGTLALGVLLSVVFMPQGNCSPTCILIHFQGKWSFMKIFMTIHLFTLRFGIK